MGKNVWIYFLVVVLLFSACSKNRDVAQPVMPNPPGPIEQLKNYNKDVTIVNWNIEWFGSSTFGGDLNLQQANAGKVLKYLNADLYGLCEIVDSARLGAVVRSQLGDDFRFVISAYPSFANSQRLAFVYNRHIFRNARARPFLGVSGSAYVSFAGGRFPFLFTADVTVNGSSKEINFILMHAKANADLDSYTKRQNGSMEMKDSLDQNFANKNIIILGDYNDHLNGSILTGRVSPYQNFVTDNIKYNSITYPLNVPGYQSTISYTNSVIDQQIISSNMTQWYINGSAKIRADVTTAVPDYNTGNTSDHYPVSSVYRF